jgi:hypothetical protein
MIGSNVADGVHADMYRPRIITATGAHRWATPRKVSHSLQLNYKFRSTNARLGLLQRLLNKIRPPTNDCRRCQTQQLT